MIAYPQYDDLAKMKNEYSTLPLWCELAMNYTPMGIIKKIRAISSHCFMLESADDNKRTGRYTFIGYDPKLEISCKDYRVRIADDNGVREIDDNPRQYVKDILAQHKSPRISNLPTFTGGLVGYFGYDYIKYSESGVNLDANDDGNFKDMDLMLFDKVVAFDHLEEKIFLIVNIQTDDLEANYNVGLAELEKMKSVVDNQPIIEPELPELKAEFTPLFDKDQYCTMVDRAKHYIHEGDIFQVVLSNRLEAEMNGSLFKPYEVLRKMNPSPYMFYFHSNDIEIAGASPETLVKLDNKRLYTYPLAGTRPRGKTPQEDKELETGLLADKKELSEHNMLVDLGRNDLGKISKFGTVEVEQYHNILRFSHVMHIGSTVAGEIRDDKSALDAMDAVLPAGTLSGAPKIRAMQIINELENNRRGIYGGAIGYIDFTGNLDTAIAIRIAYKRDGRVFIRSGAGIVADSDPQKEHQECINKAKAVVTAIEIASRGREQ